VAGRVHSPASPGTKRLIEVLGAMPVVAILRDRSAVHLVDAAEVVCDAGVRAVEFPLTTPGALDAVTALRDRRPDVLVGAGTVLTPADVVAAVDAGAQFLVSPSTRPEALAGAADSGVAMVPGAFTATEIAVALDCGAEVVKLFPATPGPAYVRALRDPFPDARLVPTGGVDLDAIPSFLAAGAFAVALGSPLVGDALRTGDLEPLADRARRAVAAGRR
jgi:2-dehydro-3-deoxyphosphogluconate aldolase/(4S)-4-hydroxy-2-oxoglutarate aldolase